MRSALNLKTVKRIHFIGIGGIGMSALARLFLHDGKTVSGSDRAESDITKALQDEDAKIFNLQVAGNISDDVELIVYTEAMQEDHPEMIAAADHKVPMMSYFEALGIVANQYHLIAVAGTHGKTTTTAMLTDILEEAKLDPTAIIGSLRNKTGSNFRAGNSKYAVVEACEYRRDFLSLTPDILVITNIEAEHLDYYKDVDDVIHAFHEFASQVRADGVIIANLGDQNCKEALKGIETNIIDYSKYVDPLLALTQPGLHNRMNAAAALAAAVQVGASLDVAKEALEDFSGTWRRFEYKDEINGAKIYDDYAHHPTEIKATLKGTREMFPDKKILLIFQPHLGSRTEKLFDDFVESLSDADHVILAPIYAARTESGSGVSSKKLSEAIKKNNTRAEYFETFDEIVKEIKAIATEGDIILIMGAGDITNVGDMLV